MVGIHKSALRPCMDEVNGILRLKTVSAEEKDPAVVKLNDNDYREYSTIDQMFDYFLFDNRVENQFMCRTCDMVYRIVEAYANKDNAYIMKHTEYHKDLLELAYRWYAWEALKSKDKCVKTYFREDMTPERIVDKESRRYKLAATVKDKGGKLRVLGIWSSVPSEYEDDIKKEVVQHHFGIESSNDELFILSAVELAREIDKDFYDKGINLGLVYDHTIESGLQIIKGRYLDINVDSHTVFCEVFGSDGVNRFFIGIAEWFGLTTKLLNVYEQSTVQIGGKTYDISSPSITRMNKRYSKFLDANNQGLLSDNGMKVTYDTVDEALRAIRGCSSFVYTVHNHLMTACGQFFRTFNHINQTESKFRNYIYKTTEYYDDAGDILHNLLGSYVENEVLTCENTDMALEIAQEAGIIKLDRRGFSVIFPAVEDMFIGDKILEQLLTKDELRQLKTTDKDREMLWLAAYRIAMTLRVEYVKYSETLGDFWNGL